MVIPIMPSSLLIAVCCCCCCCCCVRYEQTLAASSKMFSRSLVALLSFFLLFPDDRTLNNSLPDYYSITSSERNNERHEKIDRSRLIDAQQPIGTNERQKCKHVVFPPTGTRPFLCYAPFILENLYASLSFLYALYTFKCKYRNLCPFRRS